MGLVNSGPVLALMYAVKVTRFMILWISLYVVEKVYQDSFVQAVFVKQKAPPPLIPIIVYSLTIDLFFMAVLFVILMLLKAKFKTPDNTFMVDTEFLRSAIIDYAACTLMIAGVGTLLAVAAQNGRLFRYKQNGLRGIRALCNMVLFVSAVIIAIPFYHLLL